MTKTINQKHNTTWPKRIVEWKNGNTAYLSVVFSWHLPLAYQRAVWLRAEGYHVQAGGPAVLLNPNYLADVAQVNANGIAALPHHNPNATFTSRGCIRRCSFCAVPNIEGDLVELKDWEPKPIVCDNNLLACSRAHFDQVIDRLKPVAGIDFNQGLDARLLTAHHAERLAELDLQFVRLAWDSAKSETQFMTAYQLLKEASIPNRAIRVFVLIGYNDTPADALYRLQTVFALGLLPNPMRYQPLNALTKNKYVGADWTARELQRFTRYWSNTAHLGSIPFEEFR